MFIMSTGDAFLKFNNAIKRSNSVNFQCINNPTYDDYVNNNYEPIGCGSPGAAISICVSFVIVVMLIFLNLFIAIVIEGYEDIQERNEKVLNSD